MAEVPSALAPRVSLLGQGFSHLQLEGVFFGVPNWALRPDPLLPRAPLWATDRRINQGETSSDLQPYPVEWRR